MTFKALNIKEWQQFQDVEINFHNRLTILTGANGSGKTTILEKILARHNNWNSVSIAVPSKDQKTGIFSFWKGLFGIKNEDEEKDPQIGHLEYSDNQKATLHAGENNQQTAQYYIKIVGQQSTSCFFIPSHRTNFRYQQLDSIPARKIKKQEAFNEIFEIDKVNKTQNAGHIDMSKANPSFSIKKTLIGWAMQGYGNKVIQEDMELISYYEGFIDILKKILPKTLGFEKVEVREMELIFVCNNGNDQFTFEQASGGIGAIIDLAWKIYLFSKEEKGEHNYFTVIIDEVENHLHPTMQRHILPDLLKAFPKAIFIVSTHSPLVVGSVQDSNVFVLKYDKNKKIISEQLDLLNQAKTATEILDEVLGVSFTMPIWAEEKLNSIVKNYSQKQITKSEFQNMRNELKQVGLEKLMPEVIYNLIEKENEKNL